MHILKKIYSSEIEHLEETLSYIYPVNASDELTYIALTSIDKKLMAIADSIIKYTDEKISDGQTYEVTLPSGVTIDLRKEYVYLNQCKNHFISKYAYFNTRYFAGMIEIYLGYLRGEDVKADESDIDWLITEFEMLRDMIFESADHNLCTDVITRLNSCNDANDIDLREILHTFRDVAEKHNIEKVWQYHISPLY